MYKNAFELKAANLQKIFLTIQEKGPVSRAHLARQLSLSPATVSAVTKRLLDEKWIVECGRGDSDEKGGRRPILLRANPDSGWIFSVLLGKTVRCIWVDVNGKPRERLVIPKEQVNSLVEEEVLTFIMRSVCEKDDRRTLGIAIAVPGLVSEGVVRFSGPLGWRNVPLAARLQEKISLPVYVENDTNAAALDLYRQLQEHRGENLLYVHADEGVGAGVVLRGSLYRGGSGSAGELGHITVVMNGEPCDCGNRGCLGLYIGRKALERAGFPDSKYERFSEYVGAIAKTPEGKRTLAEMGGLLGVALANAINLFDPQHVVLGGALSQIDVFFDAVRNRVFERALPTILQGVHFSRNKLGWDAPLLGVAGELLNQVIPTVLVEDLLKDERFYYK